MIRHVAAPGSTLGTFQIRIPAGTVPGSGTDNMFLVDDYTVHIRYSFGGFQWTGSNAVTVHPGCGESD
jgi:hypothetical protein